VKVTKDFLFKALEQLILVGVAGIIALGVRQLQKIADELKDLKVDLAVMISKVQSHERRIETLEDRQDRLRLDA
jgi:hypothetical protein